LLVLCSTSSSTLVLVSGFTNAIFQESVTAQRTAPSKIEGVEIELPNFDELFERVQQVSPLARVAMEQKQQQTEKRGFEAAAQYDNELKWKTIENNKKRTVHKIEKIDNFQNLGVPILRFRSSLKGPCLGDAFANFIMDLKERQKWDAQIANVREEYPIHDLDAANIAMGFGKFGDCSRLGVGYCQTKAAFGVSPREQLTMCGIQQFQDGSTVIWGTEMEEWHNHLLPEEEDRHVRAKSHIFATTLVPTSDDSFDVEYVLQMDLGGMPNFLTTPVICDTVKSLFKHAEKFFQGQEGSDLERWIEQQATNDSFLNRHSILLPH
jgi:hypothetical protein